MSTSEKGGTTGRKRPPIAVFIILLFIALIGFYRVTQSPRFESYRTVDVIQLVTSGAGFGAALTGLIVRLLRPRR
jgi:hypothetical protein